MVLSLQPRVRSIFSCLLWKTSKSQDIHTNLHPKNTRFFHVAKEMGKYTVNHDEPNTVLSTFSISFFQSVSPPGEKLLTALWGWNKMIKKMSSDSGQEHPAAGARAAGAEKHRMRRWLRSAIGLRDWRRELQRHPKVSRFPISSSEPCSVLLAFCNKPGSAVLGGCKSTASCGGPCASCFLKADGDGLAGLLILKHGQLHECLVRAQNESPLH